MTQGLVVANPSSLPLPSLLGDVGWEILVCWKSVITCAFALWARAGLGLSRGRVVPLLTMDLAICQKRSNTLRKLKGLFHDLPIFFLLSSRASQEKVIGRFQILGRSLNIPLSPRSTAVSKHWLRNCYFNLEGVPCLIVTWEYYTRIFYMCNLSLSTKFAFQFTLVCEPNFHHILSEYWSNETCQN